MKAKAKYSYVKAWRERKRAEDPEAYKAYRAEEARKGRKAHPETSRAASARHYAKNVEKERERARISMATRRKRNPEAEKGRQDRYRAKQEALLVSMAGRPRPDVCELCHEDGKTVFDHNHADGAFRGWICDRCNLALGLAHDNTELLSQMIEYLKQNGVGYGKVNDQAEKKVTEFKFRAAS